MDINLSKNKTEMDVLDPNVRNTNFDEVSLGYKLDEAINEASRCLNCKTKPCVKGCPVGIDIPKFISYVKDGNIDEAYKVIRENSCLSSICGRVCPQENQCEKECVRGKNGDPVGIGRLERFVADNSKNEEIQIKASKLSSVAIIGSGPAGLSCASSLRSMGYNVTIYEALHEAGGVLVYGIPEFRLPKAIVKDEINKLINQGVKIEKNVVIGKTITIDELFNDLHYDAIFISSGAGLPKFMNIPGENLKGVFSANEILTRVNLMKSYLNTSMTPIWKSSNAIVVGGGNVAMDACRCLKRLGTKNVYIVYRRSMDELPARHEEVMHAIEEGIIFKVLTNPYEIIGDENGNVTQVKCVKMELGEKDSSGRRSTKVKAGSEFVMDADCVVMALGTSPNPIIKNSTKNLKTSSWGGIIVDDKSMTSIDGVFAGGDAVTGSATVIQAMGAGKKAAFAIDEYLNKQR